MTLRYRLHLEPDDNGTVLVTSPDLPIVTYGLDQSDAIQQAASAIDTVIASMMNDRVDVPVPAFDDDIGVAVHTASLQTELKVRLHQAMRAAGSTRADLGRRLGWHREQVDRLFRLDHNSRLDQLEDAFAALDKVVRFDIGEARSQDRVAGPSSPRDRRSKPARDPAAA